MSAPCEAAIMDFPCRASAVWQTLCNPDSYEKWYGFPNPRALLSVEPEFSLGGKLRFENAAGLTVITEFRPKEALTLSTAAANDHFTIAETERGCRVSLSTSLNGGLAWHGTAEAKKRTNREILRALRTLVCAGQVFEQETENAPVVLREPARWQKMVVPLLYGYKNPLHRRAGAIDDSLALSNIADNTESDVVVHLRALIAGLLLCVILFLCLTVSCNFERSDIVTSSGLSILESYKITLENAQNIYIGQSQNELELMLSCRGTRVSSSDFIYYSAERDLDGNSLYEIRVTYDAYGDVRRFGFIDHTQCAVSLPLEIRDYRSLLSADMTPAQVSQTLGVPVSAYWHDKSGSTTLFFGILDASRDLYDPTLTSELVVQLSSDSAMPVNLEYYLALDPRNTMPFEDLNKQYSRQYSNEATFRADRAAYERLFLIPGLHRDQVDLLLGTENVEYAPLIQSGMLCSYQTRQLFAYGDEGYRYCYNVTYNSEDAAVAVSFQNGYLEGREGTLLAYDSYAIYEGATLYELYSTMGLLPTYAVYDGQSLTLCYGRRGEGEQDIAYLYDLTVVLDAESLTVISYSFNHV